MAAGVHGLAFGNGILFAANGTNTVDKIQIDAVDVGSFAITPDQTLATSVTMTFASISDTAIPLSSVAAYSEGIAFDPARTVLRIINWWLLRAAQIAPRSHPSAPSTPGPLPAPSR